jgi:hypothetical protein
LVLKPCNLTTRWCKIDGWKKIHRPTVTIMAAAVKVQLADLDEVDPAGARNAVEIYGIFALDSAHCSSSLSS